MISGEFISPFHYNAPYSCKLSWMLIPKRQEGNQENSVNSCIYGVDVAVGVSVDVEVGVTEAVAVYVEVGVGDGVPWRTIRGASQRA